MTKITASIIKELRVATGAGMMDCKKALSECDGDFENAKDWLRKKGIASADKKSGRVAAEGLVSFSTNGNEASIVEVNSETDFVAKNAEFQALVKNISSISLGAKGDIDALNNATDSESGKIVSEVITEAVGSIGEKISLRRTGYLSVENGVISTYMHNAQSEGLGRIGVLVALESEGDQDQLQTIGKQIAMHIAAAKPQALTKEEVPAELLEREKAIFSETAKASGKPDNIIEKMVEGRIRKFYEEIVLPDQAFVIDGKTKVSEFLAAASKDVGGEIKISGYILYVLGEGIEKKEDNFAEEVAAAAGVA